MRGEIEATAQRAPVLLTRPEAAQVLGISLRATDGLIARGDLPVVRFGATVRIRPSAIDFLIEARESRRDPRGGKNHFRNR
jgi:excisionase family DNA binding protein